MKIAAPLRDQTIAGLEGQVLALAHPYGIDFAAEYARCMADGALNAIARLEGREAAAGFAFRLSDRIVGGLAVPTTLPLPPVEADRPAEVTAGALAQDPNSASEHDGVPVWLFYAAMILTAVIGYGVGQGRPL